MGSPTEKINPFAGSAVDRLHTRRRDEAWLAGQLAGSAARFLPVWRNRNLVAAGEGSAAAVTLTREELGSLYGRVESLTLLGEAEGITWFAVGLPPEDDEVPQVLGRYGRLRELREVAPALGSAEGALLSHARALVWWHRRHRFCGDCGHPTTSAEAGHVRVCSAPACGRIHFPRTDPAVIVRVTREERCLLGRQAAWPAGRYSTIAGFVEPGESLEEAVRREVMEETGVRVGAVAYHSSQPWPFPSSLMLGFTARAESTEIVLGDDELEDARWFSREELRACTESGEVRLPSPISIAHRLISDWYDRPGEPPLAALLEGAPGPQWR